VRIDGELLADDDGRALWQRFSAHMEANRGDLAGFAKSEGLASIHPAMEGGRAILVGSRSTSAPQRAYASVTAAGEGGSRSGGGSGSAQPRGGSGKKNPKKRR
jgi:hypothetical protein